MLDVLEPVARPLLRDTAHRLIRDAIVRGEIAPGAVVRDAQLAEQLGLSRAPVREALARLADEGLVRTKPQSHTRVTPIDTVEVRDAAAVVRAMHEVAVRAAVPVLTPRQISDMLAANRRFNVAVRTGDVDAALAADDELHDVPVRACGNRAVAATIDRYTPVIRRLERARFSAPAAKESVAAHRRLIEACRTGDADEAVRVTTGIWHELEQLAD
ncbi:GntR family transcriptional regulator [Amycolatopsis sp. GM8]|uniref:GntR family transcriptional regulator n=1 Tax=Amycolatopsis sp. GM8 TaxID=2896530 RepID=UPI001F44D2B0|nr:GntR family transcriptional regulator [Amycolatopsis sp. GM8]